MEIDDLLFRNVCNVIHGRPEYKDIYERPTDRHIEKELNIVELFLIHDDPQLSVTVHVPAYTCEGILNKRMYKIMAGLTDDSVVVLQGPVNVEAAFLVYEDITIYTAFELVEQLQICYVDHIQHN